MLRLILQLWSFSFQGLAALLLALLGHTPRSLLGRSPLQMELLPPSAACPETSLPAPHADVRANATVVKRDAESRPSLKPSCRAAREPAVAQGEVLAGDLPENGLSISRVYNQVLDVYPNDVCKLVYLASLRDCNSGSYLHPTLSRKYSVEAAHNVLYQVHEEVFGRVLVLSLDECAHQLNGYIRFAHADRSILINTWNALQAYRTLVPVKTTALEAKVFVSNIASALAIVKSVALSTSTQD